MPGGAVVAGGAVAGVSEAGSPPFWPQPKRDRQKAKIINTRVGMGLSATGKADLNC